MLCPFDSRVAAFAIQRSITLADYCWTSAYATPPRKVTCVYLSPRKIIFQVLFPVSLNLPKREIADMKFMKQIEVSLIIISVSSIYAFRILGKH
jgi:hypothetical protein